MFIRSLTVATEGRGTKEITGMVRVIIAESGVAEGLCHVFLHHTSASLMFCENADPDVQVDLERFLARLVPDGDPSFIHDAEGPDDMPAHIRSVLTANSLSIPVANSTLDLGTWQGLFLYEHRANPYRRRITVTVQG